MPAKHTLHVALTEPLVRYVRGKVTNGAHPSASDVVRSVLEPIMERDGEDGQHRPSPCENAGRPGRG